MRGHSGATWELAWQDCRGDRDSAAGCAAWFGGKIVSDMLTAANTVRVWKSTAKGEKDFHSSAKDSS